MSQIIAINHKEKVFDEWNDTKKLINLYGIASGMLFAHSHEIIHQNLNSELILLDEFLFPKINAAGMIAKDMLSEKAKNFPLDGFKDNEYRAPEVLSNYLYSEAANVYTFGIIAFEIMSDVKTYNNSEFNIQKDVESGARPSFIKQVPDCYKRLIEKCWAQDPKERPTFEYIVNELRNNPEFITENVNKEEYDNYIQMIGVAPISFESNKTFRVVNNSNKNKVNKFNAVDVSSLKKKLKKKVHFAINMGSLSLNLFQKQSKIGQGGFGTVYKVSKKETGEIFAVKVSIYEMDVNQEDTVINLSREVDIMSKLNHPAILKFIGYNPCNFSSKPKPCIITELANKRIIRSRH